MFNFKVSLKKRNTYFIDIFVYILVAILVTIFIISTVFYMNFETIITNQVYSYIRTNLYQLTTSISQNNTAVEKLGQQLYSNTMVKRFLLNLPPDDITMRDGLDEMENYRFISPSITSIYIYNRATNTFYLTADRLSSKVQITNNFYDKEIFNLIKNYPYNRPLVPIPRKIPIGDPLQEDESFYSGYTYLFYDYAKISDSYSIIVINVSEKNLNDLLTKMNNNLNSSTFIIDSNGKLVITTQKQLMLTNLSEKPYIKKILYDNKFTNDFFIDNVNGVKSCISFTAPDKNGWRCVSITPYSSIMKEAKNLRNRIMLIGVIIFAIGILLTIFVSLRLYSPVRKLVQKVGTLESENRDSQRTLKQELLKNIINGQISNFNTIHTELARYKLFLNPESKILVALIRVDKYKEFLNTYSVDDRNLYKFAICNISSELVSQRFAVETVDMGDDCIVLLMSVNKDESYDYVKNDLAESFENIQAASIQYLNISISFVLSSAGDSIELAPYLYNQVKQNSFYRLFNGHKCIIFPQDPQLSQPEYRAYPSQKEKALLDSLMLGSIDEARVIYFDIIEYLSSFSPSAFNHAFSHLVFNITMAIDTIQKNNFPNIPIYYNISSSLNDFETIEDVNAQFISVFDNLLELMEQKKSIRHDELITKVMDIINAEYKNQNLSLNFISDALGFTPNYIGRLFKKFTSKAIPECIMELRMQKAKELLTKTELSVAQISEQVGFTNDGYFYRAFKKMHGITPAEFRRGI